MAFLPQRTYLEENLAKNYDLSNGVSAFTSSDISEFLTFSLQFNYSSIDGSNLFILEQSNDNLNWSNLSEEYEIPVGSGNFIIDKSSFTGKYVRVNLNSTNIGIITIVLICKR
jgi:hypothetical protein